MIAFVFRPKRRAKGVARLYSARIRLATWAKSKDFALHVTDKRVAEQKMRDLISEFEREAVGLLAPRSLRMAPATAIAVLLGAFLADLSARGRSINTVKAYRRCIPKLCERCGWVKLGDVSALSFLQWRAKNEVGAKMANDVLGYMRSFLSWLISTKQLAADPLADVGKAHVPQGRGYRRALSAEELERFVSSVPARRALVYSFAVFTGLRRKELNGLTWGDIEIDCESPFVRVPGSISKNRKTASLPLRPDLAQALRQARPEMVIASEWVFRGRVPNMGTFLRDLARAGIPRFDGHGRKVDFHALRTTCCTFLQSAGVAPRVAMEIMRHSDMKLTMRNYTDSAHLPLVSEMAKVPAIDGLRRRNFTGAAQVLAVSRAKTCSQRDAQTGGVLGQNEAQSGASGHLLANSESCASVSPSRICAPSGACGSSSSLVDPIRFEPYI